MESTKNTYNEQYVWKDKVILVVEDDDMCYQYYKAVLCDSQAQILRVKDGKEAVDLCRRPNNIDLVLMDVKLPELDGYEAMLQIKQFKNELPIIIQTAYDMPEDKEKNFWAGCDDYILKPISPNKLLSTINKYITNNY